jgi:hypothetical protein
MPLRITAFGGGGRVGGGEVIHILNFLDPARVYEEVIETARFCPVDLDRERQHGSFIIL